MRVLRVALMLMDIAIVDGHGHRHMAERVYGAHGTVCRTGYLVVHDIAFIGEGGGGELHGAVDALAIRVKQEFVWIEAHAVFRVPCAVHAVAITHAVPCFGQVHVPQAVVRPGHAKQGLAQIQMFDDARAHRELMNLLDKGDIRVLEQADGVLEESAGLINGLQHTQPNLIGSFGTNNDVSPTVVSEVQPWASGVTMQRWVFHTSIVDVLLLLVEALDFQGNTPNESSFIKIICKTEIKKLCCSSTPRKDSEMNETNTRPIAMQIGLPAGHLVTQPPGHPAQPCSSQWRAFTVERTHHEGSCAHRRQGIRNPGPAHS